MNKTKHPHNRAERLKIKFKKLLKRWERQSPSEKKHLRQLYLRDKEADDALRNGLHGIQEDD